MCAWGRGGGGGGEWGGEGKVCVCGGGRCGVVREEGGSLPNLLNPMVLL